MLPRVAIFGLACLLAAAGAAQGLLEEGLTALGRGEWEAARRSLAQAVTVAPSDARAWLGLAEANRQLGREEEAEAAVEHAGELAEENPGLLRALSMYYENSGEFERAAAIEATHLRHFPDDAEGFHRAAALYLEAGLAQQAIEFARSGLERAPNAHLYNILGKAYAEAGDDEEAERRLRKAIELQPYDEDLRYDLGFLHLRSQRFEQAVAAFKEAREVFDKSPRIELGIGVALYGQRRFEDAVDAFLLVANLAPGAAQPHYFLTRVLQHAGDRMDEVLERLKVFAELDADGYLGPFVYAQGLLAAQGPQADEAALEEAESLLLRSIGRRGDFWEAHFELGALLERRRKLQEAEQALEKAVELNPNSSKPAYRLARVYQRLGKQEEAAAEFERHKRLAEQERQTEDSGMAGPLEDVVIE